MLYSTTIFGEHSFVLKNNQTANSEHLFPKSRDLFINFNRKKIATLVDTTSIVTLEKEHVSTFYSL